ncbi:pentapeptide repeat-containing protein [Taibaiella koreensis]|uniref:pentapeptide repeat-containing protein n=1 Tax=Taibaiella koreensis TaxID=1268548 RepID=UPI000E59B7E6|nr:pentapeptide repeat-containing protein [Taibaiella koreensis]
MDKEWIKDKIFDKETDLFTDSKGEYENCSFLNCNFNKADLSDNEFNDCIFERCDLSLASVQKAAFRNVVFRDCKLMGLHFEACNPFNLAFRFERSILDHSSFFQVKMKDTIFDGCQLREADFTEADLSQAVFAQCDLAGARFDQTILEKADLRSAFHYTIDPSINRLKKARLSVPGVLALLAPLGIDIDY